MIHYYLPAEHPLWDQHHLFIKEYLCEIPYAANLQEAQSCALLETKMAQSTFDVLYPKGQKDLIAAIIDHILYQTQIYVEQHPDIFVGMKKSLYEMMMYGFNLYPNMGIVFKTLLANSAFENNILDRSGLLWEMADRFWILAGDRATDYNYYTKRILLANIYLEALFFSINDGSDGYHDTGEFIKRAFDRIGVFEKIKKRINNFLPDPQKMISLLGKIRYKNYTAH